MDPSHAVLTNAGMGYRPLMTGYNPSRVFGTQGLPFTGGTYGGLAAMAMGGPLQRMMGEVGMTPMGLGHDQNVYDRLMKQRYTMMQMQAMQMAAQSDRDEYVKTFRGLAAVTGTPFGGEQRRAAQSLANSAVMMSPLFADMMPEFLDQMGGVKGSATVMAKRMIDAGRYRMDPVSGRMGMSAESVGAISNRMYGDLYGVDAMPAMKGISAGNVGSMIHELQTRGMIGTAASEGRFMGIRGDDPRASTFRAISEMRSTAPDDLAKAARATGVDPTKPGGITAEDLDKLQLDPRVADKLRSFDTERIKKSVKSYVDVVAAMRDIFGDMGKPNAPMAELVAGVEALTMGGMSQIDPGRMSMMVRQTYNLAKQTGVSMENVLTMQQHAANRAGQMGIEPGFAVQATQGALAFGGAYRAQGHAAHTAWGAMNADQVQQLDTNLRVQAASSNTANRMAVAMRLSESVGGFAADSEASRYVSAVRGGLTEYRSTTGELRSVMLNDRDFTRMMSGAKGANSMMSVSEGDVQTMLGQRDTNREYVERYGMTNTVRRLQGTGELHPFVGHRMQETLTSRFRDQLVRNGMDSGAATSRAREVSTRISQRVTRGMFDMSTEEFADTNTRNRGVARMIQEELDANGMNDVLAGLTPDQSRDFLTQSADRFYGAANRAIRGSAYRSFGNLQNVHRLTNKTTLDETDRQQMAARFTAEMQEAMSPLGHGTMLQRAVEALKNVRGDDPNAMMTVLAESLGGVRIEDINKTLMPKFQEINAKRKAVEDLQAQITNAHDPQERAGLMERLDVARRELTAQATHLSKTGEQFGLFTQETLSHGDLMRAMGTTRGLMTAQNDIIGLRGNFGAEVSPESLAAFRGGLGQPGDPRNPLVGELTDADRLAVVVDKRNKDLEAVRKHLAGVPGVTLTDEQRDSLKMFTDMVRKTPYGGQLNDYAAQMVGADLMQQNVMSIPPEELRKVTADTVRVGDKRPDETPEAYEARKKQADAAAKAVIRGRRQSLPMGASQEAIDGVLSANPTLTREEAFDIANTRVRAARLGLDKTTVDAHIAEARKKDAKAYQGAYGEVEAVADLFGMRAESMYTATNDEVKALTAAPGYKAPTEAEIKRFREENPDVAGHGDLGVNHIMHVRMVAAQKRQRGKERFGQFWRSNEGAAFREQTDLATQDIENVAERLVSSPQMVQRLGTRAIEISGTMREDQQRLRELAMFHTGGDLSRLMARDFTDIKEKDPDKARDMVAKLNTEITGIQYRQRSYLAELMGQEGTPGRRFQLGDEETFRRQVVEEHVKAGNLTREKADQIMASGMSPAKALQLEQMRRQIGSEDEARRMLRIPAGERNLTDLQRAGIAGVRFGAGSEEEAKLLYGAERWDEMNPGSRAELLKKMQEGVGTDEAAASLLGITADQLKADGPNGDLAKKIRSVKGGLRSAAHARDLIGPLTERQPGELDDAFNKRKKAYDDAVIDVQRGLFNPATARQRLGMPDDLMPADLLAQVDQRREQWGNEEEARRLLGFGRGTTLTEEQKKKLEQMTFDVGISRRIRPEDETALTSLESKNERLGRMASSRGLTADKIRDGGDGLLLTNEQQARMESARRDFRQHDSAANSLNVRAAGLRSRIAALGDDVSDEGKNRQRKGLKDQLAALEGQIKTHTEARGRAEASVGDDAKARGVSSADYLRGHGWIDREGLNLFRGVDAERKVDLGKVEDIAKGLGVKVEDLAGATGVTRRIQDAQRRTAGKASANPVELTRDILKEYGFNVGDQPSQFENSFARLLEGTAGRGMGERILTTQRDLVGYAGRKAGGPAGMAGVDQMAKAYFEAQKSGKADDMTAFRKAYGMYETDGHGQVTGDANNQFDRFQKAIQFQQQTGLLSLGGERSSFRTKNTQQDLARLYSLAMGGGEMRPGQGPGGAQGPQRMEMSGTVTLKGDQLDMSGAWGGGRSFVPGGN